MSDPSKTEPELIKEISALKKRIQELERSETERKRAEEELRFSRQQLRLLIDAGPDFFFLKDLDLRYQLVNSANARFFGREEADILGRTDVELMPERAAVACQESDRLAIREKRIVVTIEPVGDKFYETYKFPMIVADEIVGVAGIIRDITDRKRAEEALQESEGRFRALFESSRDAILMMDPEGRVSYWNPAAERMFGHTSIDAVGRNLHELIAPKRYIEAHRDAYPEFLRTGRGAAIGKTLELRAVRKDGSEFTVALSLSAKWIKDGWNTIGILRDITEQKEAEESLKRSESRLSSIIEFLPDATFAIDLEGKIISWNRAVEEMTGFSAETMLGKGNYEYAIPFYGERRPILVNLLFLWDDNIAEKYSLLRKDGDTLYSETDVPCVRGQNRRLWGKTSPLRNERGDVIGAIESIRDITDRKRTEDALRKSEEMLRLITDNMSDMIRVTDLQGVNLYSSPSHFKGLGYRPEERVGKSAFDVVHPEDVEKIINAFSESLSGKQHMKVEYRAKHADGRYLWLETIADLLRDEQGKAMAVVISSRDITDRKRADEDLRASEKKYRSVIENIQDVFYRSDARGLLLMGSPSGAKMFGYESVDEMIGLPLDIFWPDPIGRRQLLDQIKAKGSVRDFEAVLIKKDGTTFNASFTTQFYYDDQGNFLGTEGIIRDITDRKLLESQLLQARKLEAVGTLAGGVAHDFNNILMGIQGYASLMMLDLDTQHPHYERLKRIEEQVQSASDLTKQLLGFARGGRYEMRPADMNEIIRKTSSMFGRMKKELTVHGKYEKDLWTVEVDRGQIEQVLLNLYVNAWHAMPSGGELYLETSNVVLDESYAALHTVLPGNYVRVSVADTGMGMEEETRKRIFDPFFTTKEMGRGAGLGLAMVYGIMKGHKGLVDVCSEPGRGTTFTLYLPASEKKTLEERPATTEALRGSETILLVDDEPTVLAVSKAILESLGYTVHGKGSGQEAIAFFREMKNSIDLVILDMIMPVLSGSETFDRIRELDPSIKVILSSGYSLNGQAQQIMDRGCRGFIQKPFSIARLSRKIREVLEK